MLWLLSMPAFRSPLGIKHEVADADLYNWSKLEKLAPSNVRVLAGHHRGNLTASAKAHEKGWTRDEDTLWLKNDQSGEYLHTVGATYGRNAGKHFSKYLALATRRPHISLSAEQWKGLLKDDMDIVDGWHKVPAPPNANELEIAQQDAGDARAQEGVHAARAREACGSCPGAVRPLGPPLSQHVRSAPRLDLPQIAAMQKTA